MNNIIPTDKQLPPEYFKETEFFGILYGQRLKTECWFEAFISTDITEFWLKRLVVEKARFNNHVY
jgi:hypothetical protein